MSHTLVRPAPVAFHPLKQPAKAMQAPLRVASDYEPAGDQPTAIRELTAGVGAGERVGGVNRNIRD